MPRALLPLAIGAVLFAAALGARPALPRAEAERGLEPAPPTALVRVALLGRDDAGADLLWLRVVQYVGAPWSEGQKYARVEDWVDGIADLAPRFELPYLIVGILLATWPDRAAAADRVLARGEAARPDTWTFPMQRGFVAYFGALDWAAAAAHYKRAAAFPGSPPYLQSFAARLEKNAQTCAQMGQDLRVVVDATGDVRQSDAMKRGAADVLVNCAEAELKRALGTMRARGTRAKSIDELIDAGLLSGPPWAPRGMCWTIEGDAARLSPCPP